MVDDMEERRYAMGQVYGPKQAENRNMEKRSQRERDYGKMIDEKG